MIYNEKTKNIFDILTDIDSIDISGININSPSYACFFNELTYYIENYSNIKSFIVFPECCNTDIKKARLYKFIITHFKNDKLKFDISDSANSIWLIPIQI